MSIIYSGQTTTNNVIDGSSTSNLLTNLQSQLTGAGWTVTVNGSSSGIWSYVSGTTPQGYTTNIWLRVVSTNVLVDITSTTAASFNTSLQSSGDFTLQTGSGFFYQVIANPYYIYCFRNAVPCPLSQSFYAMVPYVPSFLTGLISDVTVGMGGMTNTVNTNILINSANSYSHINGFGGTNTRGYMYALSSSASPTWFDGSNNFYEPIQMAQQTSPTTGIGTGTVQAVGIPWDALAFNQASIPRNTSVTYDSNNWLVITESTNPGLMVLVP